MIKWRRCVLVSMALVLMVASPMKAAEFDLSLGKVSLHYRQHNPIEIEVEDGKEGVAAMKLKTEKYINKTKIGSGQGNFDFSVTSLAELFELDAQVKKGGLNSSTQWENGEASLSAQGEEMVVTYSVDKSSEGEADSKQVEVLVQADAKDGLLTVNYDESTVKLPSDAEEVSRKLGITNLEAQDMLNTSGHTRVFEAMERANGGSRNGENLLSNGEPQAAGGAGSVAIHGNGAISINKLDSQSTFSFYYNGPKFRTRIKDSVLNLKLLYPVTGTQVNGLGINITIVGPVNNKRSQKQVVLLDNLTYGKEAGYYSYDFETGKWLVDKEKLTPGGYNLIVDLGPGLTKRFGITITGNREVVEGRY